MLNALDEYYRSHYYDKIQHIIQSHWIKYLESESDICEFTFTDYLLNLEDNCKIEPKDIEHDIAIWYYVKFIKK
jgi:hypothetical protein